MRETDISCGPDVRQFRLRHVEEESPSLGNNALVLRLIAWGIK